LGQLSVSFFGVFKSILATCNWFYKLHLLGGKIKAQMDVSENNGTPKSSIFIGGSNINHPFWGIPIFGNTQIKPTIFKAISEAHSATTPERGQNQ